jgi:hypothetical protein
VDGSPVSGGDAQEREDAGESCRTTGLYVASCIEVRYRCVLPVANGSAEPAVSVSSVDRTRGASSAVCLNEDGGARVDNDGIRPDSGGLVAPVVGDTPSVLETVREGTGVAGTEIVGRPLPISMVAGALIFGVVSGRDANGPSSRGACVGIVFGVGTEPTGEGFGVGTEVVELLLVEGVLSCGG